VIRDYRQRLIRAAERVDDDARFEAGALDHPLHV
jgi:hypothetical protein